jgi:hypothetical protein
LRDLYKIIFGFGNEAPSERKEDYVRQLLRASQIKSINKSKKSESYELDLLVFGLSGSVRTESVGGSSFDIGVTG